MADGVNAPPGGAPKVAEVIADDLREQIIRGALSPGEPLASEAALMAHYGFSRASVREALRLLESDGLIYIKRGPGGGVRVRHPDTSQIARSFALLFATTGTPLRDLVRFRQILEPAAAAAAASTSTPEQQERLMDSTERLEEQRYAGVGTKSQLDFHSTLAECADNELLTVGLTAVQRLSEWHMPAEDLRPEDLSATRRAHRRIALAVVRGDAPGAASAMLRHLQAFEAVLDRSGRLDQPIIPHERWRNRTGAVGSQFASVKFDGATFAHTSTRGPVDGRGNSDGSC